MGQKEIDRTTKIIDEVTNPSVTFAAGCLAVSAAREIIHTFLKGKPFPTGAVNDLITADLAMRDQKKKVIDALRTESGLSLENIKKESKND